MASVTTEFLETNFKTRFARNAATSRTEEYVYNFFSFLAELGGALSLFLGFSFLMLWDLFSQAVGFLSNTGTADDIKEDAVKYGAEARIPLNSSDD